jgi:pimeloyl-ACP methyl ester carboxylesterase
VRRALAQGVVPESEQRLAAIGRAWRKSRAWRSFLTEQRALLVETPVLAAGLGSIHMPTVVVVGEHDRNVTPLAAAALAEAIPGARLVTLPGVGHLLPQQAPVDLARIVAEVAGRGARRNG